MKKIELDIYNTNIKRSTSQKYLCCIISTENWYSDLEFDVITKKDDILWVSRKTLKELENSAGIDRLNYVALYAEPLDLGKSREKRTFDFYEKICDALDDWLQNNTTIELNNKQIGGAMNKKCYECGKQICDRGVTMPGIPASFCDVKCYKKHCEGDEMAEENKHPGGRE